MIFFKRASLKAAELELVWVDSFSMLTFTEDFSVSVFVNIFAAALDRPWLMLTFMLELELDVWTGS